MDKRTREAWQPGKQGCSRRRRGGQQPLDVKTTARAAHSVRLSGSPLPGVQGSEQRQKHPRVLK